MRTTIFWALLVLFIGCRPSSKIPDDFDYGKIDNGVYKNDYFGMEVPLPAGWVVQNQQQIDEILNRGIRDIEKTNKEGAAKVREGKLITAMLLTAFKNKTDTVSRIFNSYIAIMAEKLTGVSAPRSGQEYLENTKKAMSETRKDYQLSSGYTTKNIGGKEFAVLQYTKRIPGQPDIKRVYHVRIERGFALTMMICYATGADEQILTDVLRGAKIR